jgi:UPF0755 protein
MRWQVVRSRESLAQAFTLFLATALTVVACSSAPAPEPPPDFPSGMAAEEVVVAVNEGDGTAAIARTLKEAGVIKSVTKFLAVAQNDDRSRFIQPGGYRIETKIPAAEALEQLFDKSRRVGVVTLPEGVRAKQVVALLVRAGFDEGKARAAIEGASPPEGFTGSTIEGYLLPGQYALLPGTTAEAAVEAMTNRFSQALDRYGVRESAENLGVTLTEAITIASLLEAEGDVEDFGKILTVIRNRLRIGMPLQLDATVLYALGEFGRIRVTRADLQVNSPYNTYQNRGLPPGPINNPGPKAMAALASPEQGNWIYYITVKPGDTRFTASFDEFNRWKREFQRNYADGLFGSPP